MFTIIIVILLVLSFSLWIETWWKLAVKPSCHLYIVLCMDAGLSVFAMLPWPSHHRSSRPGTNFPCDTGVQSSYLKDHLKYLKDRFLAVGGLVSDNVVYLNL